MIGLYLRLLLRHPTLLPVAIRVGWRIRRRDWYRRFPFLPLPSARYLRWRTETASGREDTPPTPHELRRYLLWAKGFRRDG
ncbi:MAG: hypothetical protein R3E98_03015 [Gemmatimonadota bacterium]|nr:hypothetical protein [Gemmatimonadota bacterium]